MIEKHWSADYIGIEWRARGAGHDGVDCYGLVRLVYREILGVSIPAYDELYATAEELEEIAAIIAGARDLPRWSRVDAGQEKEFDVAIFRQAGVESHVGMVISRGMMLHASSGRESEIVRYSEGKWFPRLVGFFRHEG